MDPNALPTLIPLCNGLILTHPPATLATDGVKQFKPATAFLELLDPVSFPSTSVCASGAWSPQIPLLGPPEGQYLLVQQTWRKPTRQDRNKAAKLFADTYGWGMSANETAAWEQRVGGRPENLVSRLGDLDAAPPLVSVK